MIDLDRTMFFKARFEIETPQGEDVLWSLVLSVRDWSLRKARRDGYSLPQEMRFWSKLKSGEMLESPDGSVRLYAALHHGEFAQTWACQHVEDQRAPGCAPRRWITEVGFEGHSVDRGTVSIITMFSDMPGYIGPLQPVPKPNVPKLIASMLENDRLVCTIDGCEFGLAPVEFLCSDAPGIHERLANPYREVPAIVISPTRAGECLIDPEVLASQLGPNATVFYTVDCGAMDALNAEFEDESLRCYGGAVRVYAPHPHFGILGDGFNHRFFSAADIRGQGAEYYMAILRRALAEDVLARDTSVRIEDVNRLNRNAGKELAFKRRAEQIQDMALDQVKEMLDEAEGLARLAEDECDAMREELRQSRQANHDLEARIAWLEHALDSQGGSAAEDGAATAIAGASELTIPAIARLFVSAFPDRIDFSERGWASLEDCRYEPRAFWSALHSMCTVLYPLYRDGATDKIGEFNSRSRFKFARGEGPQTRANSKFMREREDVYQGRRLFIEPHICSSVGDPNSPQFIRIYFNWDEETERLVIGDTKHLTNCTTRKL